MSGSDLNDIDFLIDYARKKGMDFLADSILGDYPEIDEYAFCERVSIKIDSGISLVAARIQAFNEMVGGT